MNAWLFSQLHPRRSSSLDACRALRRYTLLFDCLDALPLAPQVLLPKGHLVISPADRQNVAAQRPADPPYGRLETENLALPLTRGGRVGCPDANGTILRRRGDVRLLQDGRGPGHVADPVGVASQGLALLLV